MQSERENETSSAVVIVDNPAQNVVSFNAKHKMNSGLNSGEGIGL